MSPTIELIQCNLWSAWVGILLGMVAGALQGLQFDRPDWLGGYGSWARRLTRLGHISFFGLAFVNLAFVYTVERTVEFKALSPSYRHPSRFSSHRLS